MLQIELCNRHQIPLAQQHCGSAKHTALFEGLQIVEQSLGVRNQGDSVIQQHSTQ